MRDCWNQTTERDQDAVLAHLAEQRGWADVSWVFLPEDVQAVLIRRVRINSGAFQSHLRPSIESAEEAE